LLLTLELNKILIDYQCRSGYCGICRIKLIKGNIHYPKQKPMASIFSKKEIFPCCCQPKGNIYIEI
ncbi:MAG: class I ribonucleotide reductase maintenance protein YfaE, partial [Buchnera aphidicola]|nr:class I ribonucleotide reductase maintenance protein YfaE [Buchnera aphidicola]